MPRAAYDFKDGLDLKIPGLSEDSGGVVQGGFERTLSRKTVSLESRNASTTTNILNYCFK